MAMLRNYGVRVVTGYKSKTSVYNAVQAGLLTKPVSIGLRSVGWPDYEVEAVTAARVAGQPDEAIRALVNKLHAQRAERFEALTQTVAHA
jgi:prophage regulatory protein